MKYQLRAAEGAKAQAASAELPDRFAAEMWARDWVLAHPDGAASYVLEGGDLTWTLFRTHAGQWYLTSATERPAHRAAA